MSTFRVPFAASLVPDTSGNAWYEPSSIVNTNDLYATRQVLRYKDTATKVSAAGSFSVPKNYVGTAKIVLRWAINATTGNVELAADYRAIANTESFDPSTHQESVNSGAVAVPGTALLEKETSISLTSANLAVDDLVELLVSRDGNSGNDTAAADLLLLAAWFEYLDI